MTSTPTKKPSKQRLAKVQMHVRAFEERRISAGARRMPSGLLQVEAAKAIDFLVSNGHAKSLTAAINQALIALALDHGMPVQANEPKQ